jgi:hypothetical protein
VSLNFQNAQGNLALQLYNSSGVAIASSNGIGNGESVSLAGRAAGTYYARVYSATGARNPNYSFQINAPAPPPTSTTSTPTAGGFNIQINYAGFTASQRAIFEQAAAKWESIIVGDLPNATYNGVVVDDLLINANSTAIDGVGGTLGQAGYDRARTTGTRLPYHGNMEFDSADLASMERDGSLLNVIVHEIGHVLGFGTLWQAKGLLSGAGTSNPIFTGPQATAAYNAIFGTSAAGVPVENGGGGGTRDAHWRESSFNTEIMTGYINAGMNPLSRITVASFADLGYTVNMAAANQYSEPVQTSSVMAASRTSSGSASLVAGDHDGHAHLESANFDNRRFETGAINRADVRSERQARNPAPAAVFAILDNWIRSLRTNESQQAVETEPADDSPTNSWSAAVDLLFAGETELGCGLAVE